MRGLIVICVLAVLFVVGCGGSGHVRNLGGAYDEVKVNYNGHALYCVRGHYGSGNDQWGGLSCDWNRFHRENG